MAVTITDLANWLKLTAPETGSNEEAVWQTVIDATTNYIRSRCVSFVTDEVETFPDEVNQAILIQAARLYKRRFSPEGVAGFDDIGAVRISRLDADVETLIANHLLVGFA